MAKATSPKTFAERLASPKAEKKQPKKKKTKVVPPPPASLTTTLAIADQAVADDDQIPLEPDSQAADVQSD